MIFPSDIYDVKQYREWREFKLNPSIPMQTISLAHSESMSDEELGAVKAQLRQYNMAVFSVFNRKSFTTENLRSLGKQLGLEHLDSNLYANEDDISELRVIDKGRRGEFIPYTNRGLGWHTDGYYNSEEKTIRGFILYCQQDAADGGENQLLDPDLAFIHLYDANPEYITALMQPDTLTIPATIEDGELIRPEQKSPVFHRDPLTGALLMRYTQRKTYIEWKDDKLTSEALSLLGDLLAGDTDPILRVRLNPGEGLFNNNVLHNRSAFTDSPEKTRVMFRARYYDRISN